MKPKIGILNSGGDCAGLNAVIAAAVKSGYRDYDFVGIRRGLQGLLEDDSDIELTRDSVRGISHIGGTILMTTNKGDMPGKVGAGQLAHIPEEIKQKALNRYEKLGLSGLIVIGGDGTLSAAMQLQDAGMNIIGVPKTIDNDLRATYRTFGFDSAVEIVTESLDRVHTTAKSHARIMIVEVMGRHAGWIGLHGGIAGGADVILLPEFPFSYDQIVAKIKERADRGRPETVIIVSEGASSIEDDGPIYKKVEKGSEGTEARLGGISERISKYLTHALPDMDNRNIVLGHVQRGGAPTSTDRILAFMYGSYAMKMFRDGKFGQMASWNGSEVVSVDLRVAVEDIKRIDHDNQLVKMARAAEVTFADA